jgi:hypothetical protein
LVILLLVLSTLLGLTDEFSLRLPAERHTPVHEVLEITSAGVAVVADLEAREAVKVVVVADQWAVLLPGTGGEARDLITAVEVEEASGVDADVTSGSLRARFEGRFAVHATEMCKVAPTIFEIPRPRLFGTLPLSPDFQAITSESHIAYA